MALLSVLLPSKNSGPYLHLAIDSILDQTFYDFELLILDDGSTDGSIDTYANINDSRLSIYRSDVSKGIAFRLNQGIDLAKGKYIARMDGDDISIRNRFELQVRYLQNDSSIDLCSTGYQPIDQNGYSINKKIIPSNSHACIMARPWRSLVMPHPTWMGKAEWFRRHRYAYPAPFCAEDQELLLRAHRDSHYRGLSEILLLYRLHNNKSLKKLLRTHVSLLRVQWNYFSNPRIQAQCFGVFLARIARDLFRWL